MKHRTERHVRKVKAALETPAARPVRERVLAKGPDGSGRPSAAAAMIPLRSSVPSAAPGAWGGSSTKDETGQVGTPGTLNMFGFISGEDYNQDLDGFAMFPNYNKMRLGDAQVNATLLMLKLPIKGAHWMVKPGGNDAQDQAIADFVQANLIDDDALARSWQHVLDNAMLKFDFGCAGAEQVWTVRDEVAQVGTQLSHAGRQLELARTTGWDLDQAVKNGSVVYATLQDLAPRLPRTFYRWVEDAQTGKLAYLQQFAPKLGQYGFWNIAAEDLALHVRAREGNNYYGRAMVPETRIPTPDGWQTLGDLRIGDRVFDECGRPCRVLAKQSWTNRPCYRLTFLDGSTIIADANHQWLTRTLSSRPHRTKSTSASATVKTTQQIVDTLKLRSGVSNHSIQFTRPLQYDRNVLTIDPYLLGYWLGDGTTGNSLLATHEDDAEELAELLRSRGHRVELRPRRASAGKTRRLTVYGLVSALKMLGIAHHKSIPREYLQASVDDRMALLCGLMDSDGHFSPFMKACRFTNGNEDLVAGVLELIRSLGGSATIQRFKSQGIGHGRNKQDAVFVHSSPPFAPFFLQRKRKPAEQAAAKRRRAKHYIVSAEAVAPRDTVCIEVDSPSHLFLAGEAMVPTHNSVLRSSYPHWWWKQQLYRIDMIGHDRFHVGIPRAKLTEAYSAQTAPLEKIEATLKGLRTHDRAYMVQPFGIDYDVYAPPAGTATSTILLSIEHHNLMIARNILQGFTAQGEQRHGSFGAAKVTSEAYFDALQGEGDEIASELKQAVVKKLVDLNFDMRGRKYPTIVCTDISSVDFTQLSTAFAALADKKLVTPDDDLEDYFREIADAPELPEALRGRDRTPPPPPALVPGAIPAPVPPPAPEPAPPKQPARPTEPIAAGKRTPFEEGGRAFSRVPSPLERRIFDLHGVPNELEQQQGVLLRQLTAVRLSQLKTVAGRIAQKDGRDTAAFTDIRHVHIKMPDVGVMTKAIRDAQKRAFQYGLQTVRDELRRQGVPLPAAKDLADNPSASKNRQTANSSLVSSAKLTAKKEADAWLARALDEAIRLRRTGVQGDDLETALVDALTDDAESGAKRDAAAEINEAFGLGRGVAAQELGEFIDSCTYSAILDANTCDPCGELDGQEFAIDSDDYFENLPPNVNCEGRDNCRCVMLYLGSGPEQQASATTDRLLELQRQMAAISTAIADLAARQPIVQVEASPTPVTVLTEAAAPVPPTRKSIRVTKRDKDGRMEEGEVVETPVDPAKG